MNDAPPSSAEPTWLERITKLLQREPADQDELLEILEGAKEKHLLDDKALEMIEGVLKVSSHHVRDIMIPRSNMVVIDREERLPDFLPRVIDSGHSRFPVIGEDRDDIVGILLAKDLLPFSLDYEARFNIRDIMRPATFVPESKRQSTLLNEFRLNRNHMAIVVDEYGGVSGLVTIEDVLEEIVGDIADEHDIEHDEPNIKQNNAHEFAVKALTPLDELNDYFETSFEDEDVDTIGGLVTRQFGHVPKAGESVHIGRFIFTVLRASKRRIRSLIVVPASVTPKVKTQKTS